MSLSKEYTHRYRLALQALGGSADLEKAVLREADQFFSENPDVLRTRWTEALVTVFAFERLTGTQHAEALAAAEVEF